MALQPKQGLLRPGSNPNILELQLRSGGEEHRVRRAKRAGDGGQGPGGVVQDGILVLDEQCALYHDVRAGVRSYH